MPAQFQCWIRDLHESAGQDFRQFGLCFSQESHHSRSCVSFLHKLIKKMLTSKAGVGNMDLAFFVRTFAVLWGYINDSVKLTGSVGTAYARSSCLSVKQRGSKCSRQRAGSTARTTWNHRLRASDRKYRSPVSWKWSKQYHNTFHPIIHQGIPICTASALLWDPWGKCSCTIQHTAAPAAWRGRSGKRDITMQL